MNPEGAKEKITDDLAEMIRVRTVSCFDRTREDEEAFRSFRDLLKRRFPETEKTGRPVCIGRRGILYHIPSGDSREASVLMAHYDVVPAEEKDWEADPFGGEVRGGYLYGRGALDTKCTLCCILEAAETALKRGWHPKHDLYLSFSGEEETEGDSASCAAAYLEKAGVHPYFVLDEGGAVIPEGLPGIRKKCAMIGIAEKGVANLELSVHGAGGHASTPPRHTAVGMLSQAAVRIESHPFPAQVTPAVKAMFRFIGKEEKGPVGLAFAGASVLTPAVRAAASGMGGTFNAMVRTTAAVTMMEGASSFNVLPQEAVMGVNLRLLGKDTMDSACAYLQKVIHNPAIDFRIVSGSNPSPVSACEGEAWEMLRGIIRRTWPDTLIAPYTLNGGTDSRFFQRISGHVYKFTPMEMEKAERETVHGINERISLKKLYRMAVFYARLLEEL